MGRSETGEVAEREVRHARKKAFLGGILIIFTIFLAYVKKKQ